MSLCFNTCPQRTVDCKIINTLKKSKMIIAVKYILCSKCTMQLCFFDVKYFSEVVPKLLAVDQYRLYQSLAHFITSNKKNIYYDHYFLLFIWFCPIFCFVKLLMQVRTLSSVTCLKYICYLIKDAAPVDNITAKNLKLEGAERYT